MSQQYKVGIVATTIHTTPEGEIQVIYHSTPVVSFTNKAIILNHGGWMTATTKVRMNQASKQYSLGYHVWQKNWDWFIDYKGKTIPFDDRIISLVR